MEAIRTEGLTKKYKNQIAVDHINLSVHPGELFSLLGVNGAGKTTTIKMLSCLTLSAYILGGRLGRCLAGGCGNAFSKADETFVKRLAALGEGIGGGALGYRLKYWGGLVWYTVVVTKKLLDFLTVCELFSCNYTHNCLYCNHNLKRFRFRAQRCN